jgi:hypothetical protein
MEASLATSNLTVQSSSVTTDPSVGYGLVLHLHLDSAMPHVWPIYLLLDGNEPDPYYGFSAVVDFSSGPDQVVTIPTVGPGAHTLAYGFVSGYVPVVPASNAPEVWLHGQFWLTSSTRTVAFNTP